MQLVLNTMGLTLKVKNGLFRIRGEGGVRDVSPERLSSIAVTSPCLVSSAAIRLAAEHDVPIYFFNRYGAADACLRGPYFESIATLRRKQVYFSDDAAGAAWVLAQFGLKTEGQIANLRYLANRRPSRAAKIDPVVEQIRARTQVLSNDHGGRPTPRWSASLMGWEGQTAKLYWQCLGTGLPTEWAFKRRSRRPGKDAFNVLLNYFYGMLYALTERALFGAGLDPHLGILHADEYDRPTLAYDLIEAFRPWVDRFLLELVLTGKITPDVTEAKGEGRWLTSAGKRTLIPLNNQFFQQRKRWHGKQTSREGHVFRLAAELAKTIDLTVQRPR